MAEVFYHFDPQDVRLRAAKPLPAALDQWLQWLESIRGGTAEQPFTRLYGDLMDDFWSDYSSDLSEFLSFFLILGEGSRVGVWHVPDVPDDDAPVVLVGSEGDLEVLGTTVPHFLARLAADDALDIPDLPEPPGLEPFRSELALWLERNHGLDRRSVQHLAGVAPTAGAPVLAEWFDERADAARAAALADPAVAAIHHELEAFVDHDRLQQLPSWQSEQFEVASLGRHAQCCHARLPLSELPLERLEPLARAYRRSRATDLPDRGGWFKAVFRRSANGWATPACIFDYPPEFSSGSITAKDYRQDLAEFPRSSRWTPRWLTEALSTG